mmetsp:Transcript_60862/g.114552  ORF Transcript_60862/g.114552 Transcript_60862/m.114552 type:complete len:248 (+) Transcript_60862:502-1245(+)
MSSLDPIPPSPAALRSDAADSPLKARASASASSFFFLLRGAGRTPTRSLAGGAPRSLVLLCGEPAPLRLSNDAPQHLVCLPSESKHGPSVAAGGRLSSRTSIASGAVPAIARAVTTARRWSWWRRWLILSEGIFLVHCDEAPHEDSPRCRARNRVVGPCRDPHHHHVCESFDGLWLVEDGLLACAQLPFSAPPRREDVTRVGDVERVAFPSGHRQEPLRLHQRGWAKHRLSRTGVFVVVVAYLRVFV